MSQIDVWGTNLQGYAAITDYLGQQWVNSGIDNGCDGLPLPAIGIWDYYLASGDDSLIQTHYPGLKTRVDMFQWDATKNLCIAENSSFIDIQSPEPECQASNGNYYCFSTEILYREAYRVMALMGAMTGEQQSVIDTWSNRADLMKTAINNEYWNPSCGFYTVGPQTSPGYNNTRWENLGQSLAVWPRFDIADDTKRASVWDNKDYVPADLTDSPWTEFGFAERHYRTWIYGMHGPNVWFFNEVGQAVAAAKLGRYDDLMFLIGSAVRDAAIEKTFIETLRSTNGIGGAPESEHGGTGRYPGQLWNAMGFISMIYQAVLGMEYDLNGLTFDQACVPEQLADLQVTNFDYRDATFTINVHGWGQLADLQLDSSSVSVIPTHLTGTHTIDLYMTDSGVVATPQLSPGGGVYDQAQVVTITCATSGATLYITTDGSDPTDTNGTAISPGDTVTISTNTTLKARAYHTGQIPSSVTSADYVIDPQAPTMPGVPQRGTVTDSSISLSWTASVDNEAVFGYRLYRNGSELESSLADNTYTDTAVVGCHSYSYAVAAFDQAGNDTGLTGYSQVIDVPAAPHGPDLSNDGLVDEADLTIMTGNWLDNGCGLNGDLNADETIDLADFAALASAWTPPDLEAPTVPTGLTVDTVTDTTVALFWTPSVDNVDVAGYRVFRNTTSVGTTATADYTDTGLLNQTAYTYTVSAFDLQANESSESGPVVATTQSPVTNLVLNASFEDGTTWPTGWSQPGAFSWDDTTAHSGSRSLKVTLSSTGDPYSQQSDVDLTPGVLYTLSAWMKSQDVIGPTACGLSVRWANLGGGTPSTAGTYDQGRVRDTQDWTQRQVSFTVSGGTGDGRIDCQGWMDSGTGWFDEVRLVENN